METGGARRGIPWPRRLRAWWNLPRGIGLAAALLGLLHYLPLPALPAPGLARLHADLAPELVGLGITLILIDWAVEKRQEAELKAQLIRQMGSQHNEVADTAVRELAHHGWLYDGSLAKAHLLRANLSGARLAHADLRGANLTEANLIEADLWGAKLNNASLVNAKLCKSTLGRTNLTAANLSGAILSQAILDEIILDRVILEESNMTGVRHWKVIDLARADRHGLAIMPDGKTLGGWSINWTKPSSENASLYDAYKVDGPTFEQWKAHYLATHGGTETDLRDPTTPAGDPTPTETL